MDRGTTEPMYFDLQKQLYITRQNLIFLTTLQLYMVMGGVPAYLNAVERGKSVAQNIETICFSKDGAYWPYP
jgi:hypothetical protein